MSLQHNGGCEPSQFDGELKRQLPHLLLSRETLSGGCKKVMSRTTGVDIKIHFRAFSAFSASVKFLPFVWLELEIHPRAIKIEFPLKICKQIWKLDWEKMCSKILYEVMEQLSFLCLLRCHFIKWQKYISYIFVQVQSSVSGEVVNSNWGQSVTKSALELESKLKHDEYVLSTKVRCLWQTWQEGARGEDGTTLEEERGRREGVSSTTCVWREGEEPLLLLGRGVEGGGRGPAPQPVFEISWVAPNFSIVQTISIVNRVFEFLSIVFVYLF